jgi:uncharacterized protein (TIGR02588 family)
MTGGDGVETERASGRQEEGQSGRSAAEWTTLAVSIAVLVTLVGLVTYLYVAGGGEPAVIEVHPRLDAVRREQDAYYLPVQVINRGDRTAEDVRVALTRFDDAGPQESGEVAFRFLAGGETGHATIVFRGDPTRGTLGSVVSYLDP